MEPFLSAEQVAAFKEDGCLLLKDFITREEADHLKKECHQLIDSFDIDEHRQIFDATGVDTTHRGNEYFLESGDKVRFFFEKDAVDEKGDLLVDRHTSMNKIGHALHQQVAAFKKVTFDPRVQSIARQLDFRQPTVCQSMYIFKHPKIGGVVHPHQDATFLWSDPQPKLMGFWIALEDVTLENGCLWFATGSHKDGLINGRRFVRSTDNPSEVTLEGPQPDLSDTDYTPGCVAKGTLVLIDGFVVHKSGENTTTRSREIFTWHVTDVEGGRHWSSRNWNQRQRAFMPLYDPVV